MSRPENKPNIVAEKSFERRLFAAKLRAARAVLALTQAELGEQVGMTQKSIHRLENEDGAIRRSSVTVLEMLFHEVGLKFEDAPNGGFKLIVPPKLIAETRRAEEKKNSPE